MVDLKRQEIDCNKESRNINDFDKDEKAMRLPHPKNSVANKKRATE